MSFLFPKAKMPKGKIDNSIIEPSTRGTIIPISLGINRVSPVIGWVGNTVLTSKKTSSGGKGGGGGDIKTTVYNMSGMHILSVGEGAAITRILMGGKTIFNGRLTPDNLSSGSQYSLAGEGVFRVYWGGNTPAVTKTYNTVDSRLAGFTGLASRYPYLFYIVWDTKTLGEQKTWPNLEYEIQVNPQSATCFGKNSIFDTTSASYALSCSITGLVRTFVPSGTGGYYSNLSVITTTNTSAANIQAGWLVSGTVNSLEFSSSVISVTNNAGTYTIVTQNAIPSAWYTKTGTLTFKKGVQRGINPIAIMYQLLFETYPHGMGLSTTLFNLTDMEAIFDYFAATDTKLPASIYLKDGQSFTDGIGSIMQDCGILLGLDPASGKYRFFRPWSTDVATEIPIGKYLPGDEYMETNYAILDSELHTYSFKDANRKFSDSTILNTDDGSTKYTGVPNAKKTELITVRDIVTASMVAAYRDREDYGRTTVPMDLSKDLLDIAPGGLFTFEGIPGKYRLMEKTVEPDNATIKAEFIEDVYSEPSPFIAKEPSGLFPSDNAGAELDLQVALLEINRFTNPDADGVVMVRVRANQQIIGTIPHLSSNNSTYSQYEATSAYGVGGVLTEVISAAGPAIITTGPQFTVNGPDISNILDLTSTDSKASWKGGQQLCLIDNELFFVQGATPVEGQDATYTLTGLIRARMGTVKAAHAIGAQIILFNVEAIDILNAAFLVAGSTVYAKSMPYTSSDLVDLSDITAVSLAYKGGGFRPLPPVNLTTADRCRAFVSGTDTAFVWGYRNVLGGAGAGLGLSDGIYNAPAAEGYFKLEFRTTGGTLVRTVNNLTSPSYTYSDANRISDFSGNSFKVRVYNVLNSLLSDYEEITITAAGA